MSKLTVAKQRANQILNGGEIEVRDGQMVLRTHTDNPLRESRRIQELALVLQDVSELLLGEGFSVAERLPTPSDADARARGRWPARGCHSVASPSSVRLTSLTQGAFDECQ